MIAKQNIRLHITLPKEVIKLLDKKIDKLGVTRSFYIRLLILSKVKPSLKINVR